LKVAEVEDTKTGAITNNANLNSTADSDSDGTLVDVTVTDGNIGLWGLIGGGGGRMGFGKIII
jgi:hypothetical protein